MGNTLKMVDFNFENGGFYWSKLDFLINFLLVLLLVVAQSKKKGHPNLPKLPADANDLPAESRWPHWVTARDGH